MIDRLSTDTMVLMGKFANMAELILVKGSGDRLVLTTKSHVLIATANFEDAHTFKVVEQNGPAADSQAGSPE
jgi:hypothetical protein